MDLYKIPIFPVDKTIERQYMASYGFDGPISKTNEIHTWPIEYPIYGPYKCPIPLSLVR